MEKVIKEECREIEIWVFKGFMYIRVRPSNSCCDEGNWVSFSINGGEISIMSIKKNNYRIERKIYSSLHRAFRRFI